ncbi:MAG: hypothetical protein ACJ780_05600 [Solirubrobacteraceae bacterium]
MGATVHSSLAGASAGLRKAWGALENARVMAVLCLIIGAQLIGDAITALAS